MARIKELPTWSWIELFAVQATTGALLGLLFGLLHLRIGPEIIVRPIVIIALTVISATVLNYSLQIFARVSLDFLQLNKIVFLSNLPTLLLGLAVDLSPLLIVLGLCFGAYLTIEALTEVFRLNRGLVIKVVSGLYLGFVVIWLLS